VPNVFAACWTMNAGPLTGRSGKQRAGELVNVALVADAQLTHRAAAAGGGVKLLVVPEYFYNVDGGTTLLSRSEKHSIYRKLENISAQVPSLIIIAGTIAYQKGIFFKDTYNVCPVLLNGQIVQKLYKAGDDGVYAANGTFKTKENGGRSVPICAIQGITIGIDICMDYNRNRLGQYLAANAAAPPDIHVHVSGTNAMSTPSAQARVGGVYLHCDLGGKGANGATAWRVTAQAPLMGATSTRINPDDTLIPNGIGRLMFFTIPV